MQVELAEEVGAGREKEREKITADRFKERAIETISTGNQILLS